MTPRQSELLGFIRRHVERCGYSPSLKDMAAAIGKSHSRTERVIGQLVDLGHVTRVAHGVYVVSDLPPGENFRPVRATAPQLGALLATFDRMGNRA